jgi:hypothetical protein
LQETAQPDPPRATAFSAKAAFFSRSYPRSFPKHTPILFETHHRQFSNTDVDRTESHQITRFAGQHNISQPERRAIVLKLLKTFDALARSAGQVYFIFAGTMLSQWCGGYMFAHDKDADACMTPSAFHEVIKAAVKNPALIPDWVQIVVRTGSKSDIIPGKFIDTSSGYYIDICQFKVKKEPKLYRHHKYKVPESELFPVVRCPYEGFDVYCPQDPLAISLQMFKAPFYHCKRTKGLTRAKVISESADVSFRVPWGVSVAEWQQGNLVLPYDSPPN